MKKNFVLSILLVVILLAFFVVPVAAQGVVPGDGVEADLALKAVLGALVLITALAFICETIVEALFGRIIDHFPILTPYKWVTVYIAVIVGIVGAFVYKFDILFLLGLFVESPVEITNFGITITGISIGMGASYIHQIISKFFPSSDGAQG